MSLPFEDYLRDCRFCFDIESKKLREEVYSSDIPKNEDELEILNKKKRRAVRLEEASKWIDKKLYL